MRYDNYQLNNYNPSIANSYTPQYDPICDGSQSDYYQKVQVIKQNQAINNMAEALRAPVKVNVNHSGTVDHNINQTIQLNGTMYHYGY